MTSSSKEKLTVLITGGSKGIGLAIANKLSSVGFEVHTISRKPNKSKGSSITHHSVDLSDAKAIEQWLTNSERPTIDVLVNNVGTNDPGNLEDVKQETIDLILDTNLINVLLLTKGLIQEIKDSPSGRILFISSILGLISTSGRVPYSTSKAGILGMSRSLAVELASHGVLVNTICPGYINTDLTIKSLGREGIAEIAKNIPLKRLGLPEEIAELAKWLLSPANTYMTGQYLTVDGGITIV